VSYCAALLIKKRQRGVKNLTKQKKTKKKRKERKRQRGAKKRRIRKEPHQKKEIKNSEVLAFLSPRAKLCCCLLELGRGQV